MWNITENGLDYDRFETLCYDMPETDLKVMAKDFDLVHNAMVGNIITDVAGILSNIFGGGSTGSSCPPCPVEQPPTINDYILPAALGFVAGYLIF